MSDEQKMIEFLKADIARNRASAQRWMIGGGLLLLFMIGYMSWMTSTIKEFADPKELAQIVVNETAAQIPELAASTKENLKEQAPELVDSVGKRAIDAIPEVRSYLQEWVEKYLDREIGAMQKQVDSAFDEVIHEYRDDLRDILSKMEKPEDVDKISKELVAGIIQSFKERLSDLSGVEAEDALNNSREILAEIAFDLKRIEAGKDMTENDKRLQMVIQFLYVHMLHKSANPISMP